MDAVLSRRAWFGVAGVTAVGALAACGSKTTAGPPTTVTVTASSPATTQPPRPAIVGADAGLAELKRGNQRFVDARMVHPDQSRETRVALSKAQSPFAVVLSCSDSRLPPEIIFDQGLGDLFVVRVAGNIVDPSVMGSIEYAVGHLGAPLIVVLGHENCGAVAATVDSVQNHTEPHGDIQTVVNAIAPAVAVAEKQPGDLLTNAVKANATQSHDQILASAELAPALSAGKLTVVTGYYSLDDGAVTIA